jgi:putative SOS response-associated peptidase YedK
MPAILDEANYDAWLDPANDDARQLQAMLPPFYADRMTARPVSRFVSNARKEDESSIAPP